MIPVFAKMPENLSKSGKRLPSTSQAATNTSFCKNVWGGTDVASETRAAVGIARFLLLFRYRETSTKRVYCDAVKINCETDLG